MLRCCNVRKPIFRLILEAARKKFNRHDQLQCYITVAVDSEAARSRARPDLDRDLMNGRGNEDMLHSPSFSGNHQHAA